MNQPVHKKIIAPDGGWGWAIVAAHATYFTLVLSIFQTFGLMYKNEFKQYGFTGAESSIILATNGGLCLLCGLINGFLLNKLGIRKVGYSSATLMVSGLILTAFSTTFYQFLISYGIITSIGIGMGMSSYLLAINSYFNKKRSKATGLSMTIAGIGIILSPQLVSVLLENYTVRQTMLIVSAIAAHSFIAASLLQPVQWHAKTEVLPFEKKESDEDDKLLHENSIRNAEHPSKNTSTMKRFTKSIVNVLDLKLLKDPVFVNILVGLSVEYFSDFNFMWVIPFVLMEKGLSVDQTTTFISIYLIGDIFSKCIAPFVAAILKRSSRVMLIGSIIGVVICRMYLPALSVTDKTMLIAFALCTGAFRGLRLVYWFLTVPEYIPVERLASAFGLLHTLNGIFMIFGGPALGLLRDKTGDYTACVILLNCLALYTVVMWIVEIVYIKMKGSQTLDDSSSQ
ncbi:monocarboxylate transporter [Holotrichia oblita]|uniref:Monocarboxylate transporter n=1 Tax=Holotrichia oblita TaxID=644536 RepID=A0ACB9TA86_HOLOL|nr:monocarboxylate transporter [Holotrichia oblita]